jgi:hypothetical protein
VPPATVSENSRFGFVGSSIGKLSVDDRSNDSQRSNETERKDELQALNNSERINESQRLNESESELHHSISPAANVNVPDEVLVRSRVNMYGSVTTGATFAWTQIDGPDVVLSGTNTLSPSFTAPAAPATLIFELTAANANGTTTTYSTINVVSDEVKISLVTWSKPANKGKDKSKGKLNVIAFSSVITEETLPPVGMSMTARVWSKVIPTGLIGSATKPVEVPMKLVRDISGQQPVCMSEHPCYSIGLIEGILDPRSSSKAPLFIPPTSVVVKSYLGGSDIAKGDAIHIR